MATLNCKKVRIVQEADEKVFFNQANEGAVPVCVVLGGPDVIDIQERRPYQAGDTILKRAGAADCTGSGECNESPA